VRRILIGVGDMATEVHVPEQIRKMFLDRLAAANRSPVRYINSVLCEERCQRDCIVVVPSVVILLNFLVKLLAQLWMGDFFLLRLALFPPFAPSAL
jgi:hypothetical protein